MILVTGGSGHTGHRLVMRLVEREERVRVITRQPAKMLKELRKKVEVYRGSLDDPEQAREAVRGCRAAIALTHIKLAPKLIAATQAEGVRRAIFMSSTRRFTKFPEETARQVIAGEEAVRESGLDWTIIRASMIYGSHHDNNLVHLVNALKKYPVHPLIGGGHMKWQPVFTWDVVAALVAALDKPESIGHDYNVAGPEPIEYCEMVRTILRQLGKKSLLVPVPVSLAKFVVMAYGMVSSKPRIRLDQIQRLEEDKVFDITDARRDLGFAPISFEEGIAKKLAGTV
jgi:nucleoside-diphosphate-sugar epimerase